MASTLSMFQNLKFTAKSNISTKLMAKLKFSTILHSLQLCRSDHHSAPIPPNYRLSPANLPPPPPSTPVQIPCHVSSSSSNTVSVHCGCQSGSKFLFSSSSRPQKQMSRPWTSEPGCQSRSIPDPAKNLDLIPARSLKMNITKKKVDKELELDGLSGISSSDWFGDEEDSDEEMKSTVASSLLSTDSCPELSTKVGAISRDCCLELVGAASGFAVAKRSDDPYRDFKKSMAEMIVEKEMVEAGELEQLLRCFLSLNSRRYHGVIVEAFSEIWELLFSHSHTNLPLSPSTSTSTSTIYI